MSNASSPNGVAAEQSSAMTVVPSHQSTLESYRKGLEPMSIEAAFRTSEVLALTKMCGITSTADALARIMTGRELGLTAMQSIRGVYMIEGKPSLDASLMMGLCMQHPDCEKFEFIETNDKRATLLIKRRGRSEQRITWTIEDAQRAGLIKPKGAWEKNPTQMLRARCKSDGARLEFADVCFGLMSREEASDASGYVEAPTAQTQVTVIEARSMATDHDGAERVLLERIVNAKSGDDKKAIREDIARFKASGELPSPWVDRVIAAYTVRWPVKAPAKADDAPAATPTQDAPAEAAPAKMRQPGDEG